MLRQILTKFTQASRRNLLKFDRLQSPHNHRLPVGILHPTPRHQNKSKLSRPNAPNFRAIEIKMSTNPIAYPTTTMDAANEPIQLHIPPSLTSFTVNVPTFLANHPRYNRLACSAFIFASPQQPEPEPHLLLIHRSAHDSHFPSFWETPGGTAETTDPTVLHSLAREVYEETGLRVTRFLAQVGNGTDFLHCEPGDSMVYYGLKLSFVVEVAEVDENGGNGDEGKGLEGIPVRLDPEEHQGFVWAREEEVREGFMEVGGEIVPGDLRDRMMVAFGIVKALKE